MSRIQYIVMRRVHRVHFLRKYATPTMHLAMIAVLLHLLGKRVFVARVWENMSASGSGLEKLAYLVRAWIHTDPSVQIVCILIAIGTLSFVYNGIHLIRSVQHARLPVHQ